MRSPDITSPSLEIEGLIKRFGAATVVDGATLNVSPGEVVALLGPSGCGKTTTLRMIAGFETPDGGIIGMGGERINDLPPYRREIGLVFQDYALFPHMTVAGNIDYGMRQKGWPAGTREARRRELIRLVRLDGLEDRRPAGLSGGQQQRVALARALAIRPRLLLLDEPLSNLDAKLREALRVELREILTNVGLTTLVVTHDQEEAMALADRIAVMGAGRILQVGTAREIYQTPATRFVAEFIGRSIWLPGELEGAAGSDLRTFKTGDGLALMVPPPKRVSAGYGLSIRPEHLILDASMNVPNRFEATVKRKEYLGPQTVLHCELRGSAQMIAIPLASGNEAYPIGTPMTLGVRPDHCLVLPDE